MRPSELTVARLIKGIMLFRASFYVFTECKKHGSLSHHLPERTYSLELLDFRTLIMRP